LIQNERRLFWIYGLLDDSKEDEFCMKKQKLSRKEKDDQIMNALYHYLDHKLLFRSEATSQAMLEDHDVANVALSYATLISQEKLGKINLYVSFGALAISLISIVVALLVTFRL
jgi:hypothetical protein